MAARVGTGVTGTGFGESSVASASKSTTTGNLLVAMIGNCQGGPPTISSVADTASNSWTLIGASAAWRTTGITWLYYAANITGHASNVVTATFSGTTGYCEIIVEEFSGLATSSVLDGSYQSNASDSGSNYTTSNITTTSSGLVVLGAFDWEIFTSASGTPGNPDFSVGAYPASNPQGTLFYLLSGSAQTVTPGGSTDASNGWGAVAQAFKDASTQSNAPRAAHLMKLMGAM